MALLRDFTGDERVAPDGAYIPSTSAGSFDEDSGRGRGERPTLAVREDSLTQLFDNVEGGGRLPVRPSASHSVSGIDNGRRIDRRQSRRAMSMTRAHSELLMPSSSTRGGKRSGLLATISSGRGGGGGGGGHGRGVPRGSLRRAVISRVAIMLGFVDDSAASRVMRVFWSFIMVAHLVLHSTAVWLNVIVVERATIPAGLGYISFVDWLWNELIPPACLFMLYRNLHAIVGPIYAHEWTRRSAARGCRTGVIATVLLAISIVLFVTYAGVVHFCPIGLDLCGADGEGAFSMALRSTLMTVWPLAWFFPYVTAFLFSLQCMLHVEQLKQCQQKVQRGLGSIAEVEAAYEQHHEFALQMYESSQAWETPFMVVNFMLLMQNLMRVLASVTHVNTSALQLVFFAVDMLIQLLMIYSPSRVTANGRRLLDEVLARQAQLSDGALNSATFCFVQYLDASRAGVKLFGITVDSRTVYLVFSIYAAAVSLILKPLISV